MQGVRYLPYKRNAFMTAVRKGRINKVREIISSRGPCYAEEWNNGYFLLCTALKEKRTEVAKLLLTNGSKVNNENNISSNTPLHFAARNGDIEIVQMLLDRGANIDAKNTCGNTPLHNAVQNMETKITGMLLNHGANVDAADQRSITPLHLAVRNNSKEITNLLLSRGANVDGKRNNARSSCLIATNTGFRNGTTPLHLAIRNGNEEITELLLSKGADVNARRNDDIASVGMEGCRKIVKHFLKHGAHVYSLPRNGQTPLYFALEKGHEKIVKLLLEHGANIDAKDKDNKTMLQLAVEKGSSIFVKNTLKLRPDLNNRSNSSVLNIAVQGCGIEYEKIVKYLLRYGFTVNPEDAKNFMHAAIKNGHLELVEELLKHVTDVNMLRDPSSGLGYIPLHVASIRNRVEVAKLLINYGANINAEGCTGMTALHFATQNGHEEVVELLLKCGANVNATTKFDFKTPLHLAAEFGYLEIAKRLLEIGAKVAPTFNHNALTLLHLAVKNGHREVVELLLKFGASVDSTDEDGATALHFASTKGDEEVVTALLEHGSDITLKNKNGYTAYDLVICGLKSGFDIRDGDGHINFNSVDDHKPFTSMNIARILERHMVKIKAANLYAVNKYVLSSSIPDEEQIDFLDEFDEEIALLLSKQSRDERRLARNEFQYRCEREVASMRCEKFANTCVTFYDILIKNISQLAMCAKNESIVEAFRSEDFKEKFPMYGGMISNNFKKGEKRKEFLEQGNKILDILFNDFSELPRGCIERILGYLNDDDLRTLMEAGKPYTYVKEKCSNERGELYF